MNKTEKIVRQFMSETMPFTYKANNDGRLMTNLANFYDWLKTKEAINYTRCYVGEAVQLFCTTCGSKNMCNSCLKIPEQTIQDKIKNNCT